MKKTTKKLLTRFLSVFMIALLLFAQPGLIQAAEQKKDIDYNKVPPLLITELMPDSKNFDSADAYEYIEVYNNTDQPINFKDYQIIYRYPTGPADDVIWTPENRDVVIQPGKTLVLWVKPTKASINDLTVDDFNAIYGTELVEGVDIIDMPNSGAMHNQRMRDIVIRTNTGEEVVRAQYNKAEFDVTEHKGILYKYPEDGTNKMVKVSANEHDGTPGTVGNELVGKSLVPEAPVSVDPTTTPTLEDNTVSSQPLDNVEVSVKAIDQFLLSTLTLNYRKAGEEDYHTLNLEHGSEGVFSHTIPFQNILGAEEVEYYFEATNGLNTTTSDVATINVTEATSSDTPPLLITELVPQTLNINAANAYEYVEVYNNTNQTIDFGDFHISYRLPNGNTSKWFENLENALIGPGENLVLWVDNGKNDEATPEMFKENFGLAPDADINLVKGPAGAGMANGGERDLVIVANTGEEIVTAGYNKPGDKNTDEVGVNTGISYHYPIGSNEMVKVKTGYLATPGTVESDLVPKTANTIDPTAKTTIEDKTDVQSVTPGESVEIVASAEDDFLVTNMTLMYKQSNDEEFTSVDLKRDSERLFRHTVKTSLDGGNLEYYFVANNGFTETESAHNNIQVEIESVPVQPSEPTPENGAVDVQTDATLSVQVSDVLGGSLDVTFYQGKSYNTSQTDTIKVYQNAADVEPPKELVTDGEVELTAEEYQKLRALNGEQVQMDSTEQFPYHRFEITLDEDALTQETVEAVWHGSSLEGRKVSLYAWNYSTEAWEMVDNTIAESEESFSLKGDVSVAEYVQDGILNVLAQDEIPENNVDSRFQTGDIPNFEEFDYNFIWLADTQFYTEVFPWHFENQVNWIADNKDKLNIEYVFHSGDIVNTWNQKYQWEFADEYMSVLEDANIPYGILAGNHDVELPQMDYTNYYEYFGEDRFADQPHYGGSFKNNRGHYDLISVQGVDFIMVHMGWQPQDDGIAWMNDVLAAYPNRVAILNFHQYLDENGITAMGQKIFDEVVVPNENVQLVIGGHHYGSTVQSQIIEETGREVYELMGNFQGESEGGLGYLNVMSIDPSSNSMYVTSYSPSLDEYNFYEDTPYRVPLTLEPMTKRVATDYFEVNAYTDVEIGSVEDVASGDVVEVLWSDLEKGKQYSWYATATIETGTKVNSDMWHFRTEGEDPSEINEAPVIHAEDVTITQGEEFDPFANVTATDAEDGDLTDQIELIKNEIVPNVVGSYEVTYKVVDSDGATATKTITVTVEAKDATDPPVEEPEDPSDSEDPEDPEEPEVPGDDNEDGTENDGAGKDDGDDSGNKDGDELPKTATNMYTWLLLGMSLIVAAGIVAFYRKKAYK